MPRFCTHCGKLLKDDERFCTTCGTPVTDDGQASQSQENAQAAEHVAASDAAFDTAATTVQSAQQPAATQSQQADVTVQSAHQPAPAPQPEVGTTQQWAAPAGSAPQQPIPTTAPQAGAPAAPKNNNALLIGIIAALIVVIIALVVFFMIKPFDKGADDTKGTTIEKVKIDHDNDDASVKGDPNKLDDDDDDDVHDAATISEQNVYDQLSSYYSRLSDLDQQVRDCATISRMTEARVSRPAMPPRRSRIRSTTSRTRSRTWTFPSTRRTTARGKTSSRSTTTWRIALTSFAMPGRSALSTPAPPTTRTRSWHRWRATT